MLESDSASIGETLYQIVEMLQVSVKVLIVDNKKSK